MKIESFDTRDDFDFPIVNVFFLSGIIPICLGYGVSPFTVELLLSHLLFAQGLVELEYCQRSF